MLSPVEEIKARLDVVEVIKGYIRLDKAGINYKANCPFHGEKTASFFVSPTRQIWHCFGCARGGDVFKFVMEIEGNDFPEALRMLAGRAGVELKREDPSLRSERNRLYEVNEAAAHIFEEALKKIPAVHDYLEKRRVSVDTIAKFRIGFAPQSWEFLLKNLATRGFRADEAERAGLVIRSEQKGGYYDRFRSRIMFPIADGNGRIVGFGGRIFELPGAVKSADSEAKYINTPQTMIYDKSRILYGFNHAKMDIRAKNEAVIVEGYMDCVMSHQAGVGNTVAVSGTALTPQQLKMLRRLADGIACSFDTDAAGENATRRSLALAAEFDFARTIVHIPSGKDPADTVAESEGAWRDAVAAAKAVVPFYFEKATTQYDLATAEGKKSAAALVLPFIADLADEIEKSHWVATLADRLGVREDAVWKEISRRGTNNPEYMREEEYAEKETEIRSRRELLEERFLTLAALLPPEATQPILAAWDMPFALPAHEELCRAIRGGEMAQNELYKDALALLKFKGEVVAQLTSDPEKEFSICKRELEKECVREYLERIAKDIEVSERAGNSAALTPLLESFHAYSQRLKSLS